MADICVFLLFPVKVYKCSAMADICGSCLTMDAKFNCGWCENKCSIQKQCLAKWLGSSSICPNPVLTRVSRKNQTVNLEIIVCV